MSPEKCGYGIFIKNTRLEREILMNPCSRKRGVPIGWTCSHPNMPLKDYRMDRGYYPFCMEDTEYCPLKTMKE